MIRESSIKEVYGKIDIIDVISDLEVNLTKKGSNYTACCPFHEEHTPSFMVSPTKGIFKCFGCGQGGDAVNFVRQKKGFSFYEAMLWLGKYLGVEIEFEDNLTKEQREEKINIEKQTLDILDYAKDYYHKTLMKMPRESDVWQMLIKRGIDEQIVINWHLGFAHDNSKNLTDTFINKGWHGTSTEIGFLVVKSGVTFDFYRNVITIPLTDRRGNLIGFSGRRIGENKDYPKYVNPRESRIYNKSEVLFGLSQAQPAIKRNGYVYIVEGYFDLIQLHRHGVEHVVAPCGTAITSEQAKILRKFTDHVVLMGDGDQAGINSMFKSIDMFLAHGFRVEVVQLPESHDPDSYIQDLKAKEVLTLEESFAL